MKSVKEEALVSAAFHKLIAKTHIERAMVGDRSVQALTRHFQALPWDTTVFTLTGRGLDQWTVDVEKDGPTLTLTPADAENESRIEVAGDSFRRHLTAAFEEAHPGLHLAHDESLLKRLLHDHLPERPHLLDMIRRHEEETLRKVRLGRRESERRREEQWRANRAVEHQYQYAIWYQ